MAKNICLLICNTEVEEQLQHLKNSGKASSVREAADILAKQLSKIFGQEVKPNTLRKKAQRAKLGTNVSSKSKLKKWTCGCTNVRVAVSDFRARCLKCGNEFKLAEPW